MMPLAKQALEKKTVDITFLVDEFEDIWEVSVHNEYQGARDFCRASHQKRKICK